MSVEDGFNIYGSQVFPKFLQFETDNTCNANCLMCPKRMMKPRGKMPWSRVLELIDRLAPYVNSICPFLMQEPSCEPRLQGILNYVKQVNHKVSTVVYSNMGGWTKESIEKAVKSQTLDTLVTSYYAPTPELHHKYQPGVDTDEAGENIKYFRKLRDDGKYLHPTIEMHYLAVPELCSEELVREYVRRWTPYVDSIGLVHFDTFHGDIPQIGDNDKYFGPPAEKRHPCDRLWSGFNVLSNGDVVACCIDYDDTEPLGNVFTDDPLKIWRESKRLNELRQMHVEGRQSEIPLCRDCTLWRHQHDKRWNTFWGSAVV